MALKDKLMTLEDFKAVRDVDVASNQTQFSAINESLSYIGAYPLTWEQGRFSTTGGKIDATTRIRTIDYIPVTAGETFVISESNGALANFYAWNIDGSFNSYTSPGRPNGSTYTVPEGVDKIKLVVAANLGFPDITPDYGANVAIYRTDSVLIKTVQNAENISGLQSSKADKSNTYTKQEVDTLIEPLDSVRGDLSYIGAYPLTWEQGRFSTSGTPITATGRIRTIDYIPVTAGETFVISESNGALANFYAWNIDGSFNSYTSPGRPNGSTYTVPEGVDKIKLVVVAGLDFPDITPDYGTNVAIYRTDSALIKTPILAEVSDARLSGSTIYNNLKARLDADKAAVGTEISAINESLEDLYDFVRLYDAPVKIFRYPAGDRWFYVRTKFYEESDVVYCFGTPGYVGIDNAFSFDYIKLIPSGTPLTAEDTVNAYESASIYKFCKDEIPSFVINGVNVGSNHGNPNYTQVVSSSHGQTESDIGTVWTDSNNFEYTLVNVLNENRLIFGTLDTNGFLVVRNPETLTKQNGNKIINVTSSAKYQLRRSALNRVYKYYNENGIDLAFGGSGNNVIISEDYDINDQSAGLAYLRDNVGTCTNSSYYDNAQTEHLAHVHNIFQFNRGGSITVYGSLTAKKSIIANMIYGMMSGMFGRDGDPRPNYMYVPNSGNAINIVTIDNNNAWSPTYADDGSMHYRYYQLTSDNNAHFLQFLNNYGDVNGEERRLLPYTSSAFYSVEAKKFYLNVARSKELANGDIYSWSYGRGPYKYSNSQTVLTYFDVGNGYVVSMDWHTGHSGYVKLPDYMSGMSVSVLDKTDSVTDIQEHTCLSGLKLNCSGYGYAVLLLS